MRRSGETGGGRAGRERGQSSVLGVVLVLGMVIAGTAVIVVIGSAALGGVESQSELARAEHSMTLFNSRVAMVALGDSPMQTITFGDDSGSYEVREDESWLRIRHVNYTGNGHDEMVYNASLGTVVYENGGTEIAYQGGGVWRKSPEGEGMMISPPEFHYRAATLTLPVVRVHATGNDNSGTTVEIERESATRRIFPNTSSAPTPNVGPPYDHSPPLRYYKNPVANGTVNVTIKSPYYHGWAEYFRTNTEGVVKTFPNKERVRVTLISLAGSIGDFQMPNEGNSLDIKGMGEDHPVSAFDMTLKPDPHYQNMHWSFYADEGNEQFELHFYSDGQCNGTPGTYNGNLDVSLYYYNSSGASAIHEEWQRSGIDPSTTADFDIDCSTGELSIDLMSTTSLEYGDISMTGSDNKWLFGPEIAARSVPTMTTSFGVHPAKDGGPYDASTSDQAELGYLVNHYLQLLGPTYDLTVTDGPGGSSRVDESASSGTLRFATTTDAQYITFLHVTENDVNVSFR